MSNNNSKKKNKYKYMNDDTIDNLYSKYIRDLKIEDEKINKSKTSTKCNFNELKKKIKKKNNKKEE